jgi:hypothetical protein
MRDIVDFELYEVWRTTVFDMARTAGKARKQN